MSFEKRQPNDYSERTFKLDRMSAILERLGNPQLSIPAIHVAGTKGKGSTCELATSILRQHGLRVGLFTSPHVDRFEERIRIDGQLPDEAEVVRIIDQASQAVEAVEADGLGAATFFEIMTAMGWLHFRDSQVDVVVLEVGLGGRLDTTNLCDPRVTVITNISLDHTNLLGDTISQIASEKAGIIKPGVPLVCAAIGSEERAVISDRATELGAPSVWLGKELSATPAVDSSRPQASGDLSGSGWTLEAVQLPVIGGHQLINAVVATEACKQFLGDDGVSLDAVRAGLAEAQIPVRIELIRSEPPVIVDSAHNPASIVSLVQSVNESFPGSRRVAVFAASRDKDVRAMLRSIAECFDSVVLTEFGESSRSMPLAELTKLAEELQVELRESGIRACTFECVIGPKAAWKAAFEMPDAELICVTGSFFLAAEIRALVSSEQSSAAATPIP